MGEKAALLVNSYIERSRDRLKACVGKADALSPLSILSRGYSIAENKESVIHSISDVQKGDEVEIILTDGRISANVTDIRKGEIKP